MLKIESVEPESSLGIPCQMASAAGGVSRLTLWLQRGRVSGLPDGLDALLITSDLQGIGEGGRLLGEVLADEYLLWAGEGKVPRAERVGVLLAGDLFSVPRANVRGASGDVRAVWRAFAQRYRWVAGVAGNHDTFGTPAEESDLRRTRGLHMLDGRQVDLNGMVIGGVGGIIGKPNKLNRKIETDYRNAVQKAGKGADILVLHEPPAGVVAGQMGRVEIRDAVESAAPRIVVCGHTRWDVPFATRPDGIQLLNVDGRAILLERATEAAEAAGPAA